MNAEEAEEMCERIAEQLGEHFDAVQILVSWNEDGFSLCTKKGSGNWYARIGMAREFLVCDQAQTNANEMKRATNSDSDPPGEGDCA